MGTKVIRVRNVNFALHELRLLAANQNDWHVVSPRGMETMEWRGPVITEYTQPTERILWSKERDTNPFFNLFEALWILDGRKDVKFLAWFLPKMAEFSDDGETFHAPYGQRLRYHFSDDKVSLPLDQIDEVIKMLTGDPDTRRAVMSIWDPTKDLGTVSKDIPCNDMLMFKAREGRLNLLVACRSNDAILGAYGTNVVQFSIIQEFVARAAGLQVGEYRQVSDSFHIYTSNEAWKRVQDSPLALDDLYSTELAWPYPLVGKATPYDEWLKQLSLVLAGEADAHTEDLDPFLSRVAVPLLEAWSHWKNGCQVSEILDWVDAHVEYCDWRVACCRWLLRRRKK